MPEREFEGELLTLANERVHATFSPEAGGRLTAITRLPSGKPLPANLTFSPGEETSQPGLVRAAQGDEELLLADSARNGGLGWQLRANAAGAAIELEYTIRNRTLEPLKWNPGVSWDASLETTPLPGGVVIMFADGGLAILFEGGSGRGHRRRFAKPRTLAPRWGETIQITLVPFSSGGVPVAASRAAVVSLVNESIRIEPSDTFRTAKLVLLSATGQTMEANANLDPTAPLEYTFSELGGQPKGLIILDSDRNELLRYESGFVAGALADAPEWNGLGSPTPADYGSLHLEPATRYWACQLRSRDAFIAGDFESAAHHAESALLFNGDDPLTWCEKAIALRRLGDDDLEAPELPNVHFLAPLEPLVRSEAFLRGGDSPLILEPLADHPEEIEEAACHYLSLGLFDDAARLLAGAVEVSDRPMFRYLYAYCALQSGQMEAEAAGAIAAARELKEAEPWPWRVIERAALADLTARFPAETRIREYFARSNRPDSGEVG